MITLLLGGARSGKSALAVALATAALGPVAFVATARADDDELRARIAGHRHARPSAWPTIEEPLDLPGLLASIEAEWTIVVDCLTLWVANLLEAGHDDATIQAMATASASAAAARKGATIVVSNEVGSGIVPVVALARRYRDLLGRVNAAFAVQEAFLVVAGRALRLEASDAIVARWHEAGLEGRAGSW